MKKWILFLIASASAEFLYATDLESGTEMVDPALLPKTAFSSKKCTAGLPVRKGKNPWLKIVKKKAPSLAGMSSGNHLLDSYYFVTANRKSFGVVNTQDSIYDTATAIEKIDCKHGLLYFRKSQGEVSVTTHYRVYDLYTGEEYRTTEGAVTMAPNGQYLLAMNATDREQKCGRSESCEVRMKFYKCSGREKKKTPCQAETEETYEVTGKNGQRASFNALQVKWTWMKPQKLLTLKIGGSSKSPAKINCTLLPSYNCKAQGAKGVQIHKKEMT